MLARASDSRQKSYREGWVVSASFREGIANGQVDRDFEEIVLQDNEATNVSVEKSKLRII